MGFVRGADEGEAASWVNYASTGSRVHYERWSRDFSALATSNTFPGFVALALIVVAFSDRRNTADPRFQMCAVAAAGCAVVSFAPLLPFYGTLHESIPLFQAVRALHRIGQVVLLMVAVLAGFGMASLARSWRHAQSWPVAVLAVLLLVNGEALRAPIGYTWFDGVPDVYDALSKEPAVVVAEAPFPMPQQWFLNAPYMVNTTRHWKPILNGYSGFRPPSYDEILRSDARVPVRRIVAGLVETRRDARRGAPAGHESRRAGQSFQSVRERRVTPPDRAR